MKTLGAALARYKNAELVWCQEEPQNMGAWNFVDRRIEAVPAQLDIKGKRPLYAGRPEMAATATGMLKRHNAEQARLVDQALAPERRRRAWRSTSKCPTLGKSVTEASVGRWLKQAGDAVAMDDPLVEIETDKVTLEVNATAAGTLPDIVAPEGANVAVGAMLGHIAEGKAAAKPAPRPAAAPAQRPPNRPAMPAAAPWPISA